MMMADQTNLTKKLPSKNQLQMHQIDQNGKPQFLVIEIGDLELEQEEVDVIRAVCLNAMKLINDDKNVSQYALVRLGDVRLSNDDIEAIRKIVLAAQKQITIGVYWKNDLVFIYYIVGKNQLVKVSMREFKKVLGVDKFGNTITIREPQNSDRVTVSFMAPDATGDLFKMEGFKQEFDFVFFPYRDFDIFIKTMGLETKRVD
jgi:hypothetical protein